jgi:hypothetical protein
MRKPVGIALAGIVLGLIALSGTVFASTTLGVFLLVHSLPIPDAVRVVAISATALQLSSFLFCAWTMIGIFRFLRRAKIAAIVIAAVIFFFSLVGSVGILLALQIVELQPSGPAAASTPNSAVMEIVLLGLALFCLLFSLLGIWWLVHSDLAPVRGADALPTPAQGAATAGTIEIITLPQPRMPASRIVIVVWAWTIFLAALSLPLEMWMKAPLFLFGAVLHGRPEMLVLLILWAAEIYMAIGLLRKWKSSWHLALFLQLCELVYAASFALPRVRETFTTCMRETITRSPHGTSSPIAFPGTSFFISCLAFGTLLIFVFLWALLQRKEDYLGNSSRALAQ